MSRITYSEDVPTVPGYYWERRNDKKRIVELHDYNMPRHWREMRQECLSTIQEQVGNGVYTLESIAPLVNQPEEYWKIEWAGPIPEPE
jgi:hypothetical protein